MGTPHSLSAAEFHEILSGVFSRLERLTQTKGQEYANSEDQLANFRRLATALDTSPEAVCYVYLAKHLDAIQHHIRRPDRPVSEPIAGRIDDAILYLVLLWAILHCDDGGRR